MAKGALYPKAFHDFVTSLCHIFHNTHLMASLPCLWTELLFGQPQPGLYRANVFAANYNCVKLLSSFW